VVSFVVASILGQYFLLFFMLFFYGFFYLLNPAGRLVFCAKKLQSDMNLLLSEQKKGLNIVSLLFVHNRIKFSLEYLYED
jgi:hypothetical protein